jgi:hypothetical protein
MNSIHGAFSAEVALCSGLVLSAHGVDSQGDYIRSLDERSVVSQGAYIRLFISWERFIESAFHYYLMGGANRSGQFFNRYALPRDEAHAAGILKGNNRFVDWSAPERVVELADLYFEAGGPIAQVIRSSTLELLDAKTIRNSAAHLATSTQDKLIGLLERLTGTRVPTLTTYGFLMTIGPAGSAMFTDYSDKLSAVATLISG